MILRHIFGSQEAAWGLHWDGWSKDKFSYFLEKVGFEISSIECTSWHCLDNVIAKATKSSHRTLDQLIQTGKELLKLSMVNNSESEIEMWKGSCNDFEKTFNQMVVSRHTLSSLIPDNAVIYDVGANIGDKTEDFLKLNASLVVAVEPQSSCISKLKNRFQDNNQVVIVPLCLNESEDSLNLSICTDAPTISTCSDEWKKGRFSNYKWDKKEVVEATTLDHLIECYGAPYYCKIDVEGFEYSVLKGLHQPLPLISIEFTKEFFDTTKKSIQYLKDLGMSKFNFSIGESPFLYLPDFVDAETLIDTILQIQDTLLWGDIYAM